jgi:hypothetical protein
MIKRGGLMSVKKLPETVEEAVIYLIRLLDENSRNNLKKMRRNDLHYLHHGYGSGVRAELGLWGINTKLCADPAIAGMHPDDASMVIITLVWERLQYEPQSTLPDLSTTNSPDIH